MKSQDCRLTDISYPTRLASFTWGQEIADYWLPSEAAQQEPELRCLRGSDYDNLDAALPPTTAICSQDRVRNEKLLRAQESFWPTLLVSSNLELKTCFRCHTKESVNQLVVLVTWHWGIKKWPRFLRELICSQQMAIIKNLALSFQKPEAKFF